MPRTNIFAGSPIDRLGDARKDVDAVAALLGHQALRLLPMRNGRHLVHRRGEALVPALLRADEAPLLADAIGTQPHVLLGLLGEAPVVAIDLGDEEDAAAPVADAEFVDLRAGVDEMAADDAALLAHARGFLHWRRTHRFCGRCGASCVPVEGGTTVRCTGCGASHFPRTDPAVIMLVTNGDRALLARNARFAGPRRLSTLAGFVEPGESLEETVAREAWEECGVRVRDVRYHSSQPWPFPASIMLGFRAETDDLEPRVDGVEITEAGFFTRAEVRAHDAHGFALPMASSIARRLIEDWCDEGEA